MSHRILVWLFMALGALALGGSAPARGSPGAQGRDPEKELDKVRRRVVTQGKVCPDPERPCDGFKSNELSFTITKEVIVVYHIE